MNYIALISAIALCCTVVSSQNSDLCRVAAICGDGRDFNEVTLNFTEIAGNNAGVTTEVLAQITDQLNAQFQDSINTLKGQLSLVQHEQARLNECPSQTYTGFTQSSDFVKHRGYFPKMTQFHMCGWIDYIDVNSARNHTVVSYAVGEEPAALLWRIRSNTDTSVKIGDHSFDFTSHPSLSGNHFVCVGYGNEQSVSLSIDGSTVATMSSVDQLTIPEGGSLVLGKNHPGSIESDEDAETFGSGSIGNFMIWSRAITEGEITDTASSCNCPKDYVVTFQHSQVERHGDTQYSVPASCHRVVQQESTNQ